MQWQLVDAVSTSLKERRASSSTKPLTTAWADPAMKEEIICSYRSCRPRAKVRMPTKQDATMTSSCHRLRNRPPRFDQEALHHTAVSQSIPLQHLGGNLTVRKPTGGGIIPEHKGLTWIPIACLAGYSVCAP